MSREQTVRHTVVREGNRHENQHRHDCVNEVREPNFVPLVFGHLHAQPRPENRQPFGGHEPIVDLPIGAFETVGEVKEEAGESAETEEGVDHQRAHRRALAVAGDRRQKHLEREESSGGQEVDEHGCLGQRLLHSLGHYSSFAANFGTGGGSGGGLGRRWVQGRRVILWSGRVDFDSDVLNMTLHLFFSFLIKQFVGQENNNDGNKILEKKLNDRDC